MVSKGPKDSSLEAELVAVLEIKREKLELAEASKQELAARLATLASAANAKVKEAGELRKQLDEIALVLECACCFEKIGAGCAAFGCGHIFCNRAECGSRDVVICPECRQPVTSRVPLFGVMSHVGELLDTVPAPTNTYDAQEHERSRLEEERSRAAEAARTEDETRKSYEDRLKQQADRIHVLEEEQRRAVLTQAEAATREEETRQSYEDRLKQQADRIHVLEEEVAAFTQEASQLRAKLQKRERTEAGAMDAACERPSKQACVDRRASATSEQGASSYPDLPTAYEQNDVSERVGRLRGNDSGLVVEGPLGGNSEGPLGGKPRVYLLSGGRGGGQRRRGTLTLRGHSDGVTSVAFNQEGTLLASSSF